jgi:hypothetical protein
MKVEGLDWMDWLHKIRAESEAERKRSGLSVAEWLDLCEARAREIRKEIDAPRPFSRPGAGSGLQTPGHRTAAGRPFALPFSPVERGRGYGSGAAMDAAPRFCLGPGSTGT